MIGTAVEREGITSRREDDQRSVQRHGAEDLRHRAQAYGAGLYAMAGPAYDPRRVPRSATASIAVMGPQAAINAVFYNQAPGDRGRGGRARRTRRCGRIRRGRGIPHLADSSSTGGPSPRNLARRAHIKRYSVYAGKRREWPTQAQPVTPGLRKPRRRVVGRRLDVRPSQERDPMFRRMSPRRKGGLQGVPVRATSPAPSRHGRNAEWVTPTSSRSRHPASGARRIAKAWAAFRTTSTSQRPSRRLKHRRGDVVIIHGMPGNGAGEGDRAVAFSTARDLQLLRMRDGKTSAGESSRRSAGAARARGPAATDRPLAGAVRPAGAPPRLASAPQRRGCDERSRE